jgi:hypothetical protein
MRIVVRAALSAFLVLGPLANFSEASLAWERVPGAPAGEVLSLAANGADLAVAFRVQPPGGSRWDGLALRTGGEWEVLPLPEGRQFPSYTAVALSGGRLLVGETSWQDGGTVTRLLSWDRAGRSWTALSFLPMADAYEGIVALEDLGQEVLLLSSRCRLMRFTGSTFVTPEGWPSTAFDRASCQAPFVRDSGRLFVVAGAVFEYRAGRVEYPPQPEGPERRGVAVLPEGLAFLQSGAWGRPDKLFLPGRATPLGTPLFATGPLLWSGGSLYTGTYRGPARLGEGRWWYTRPAGLPGTTDFGPTGPFVEAGGELYGGSRNGLFLGRTSVRRLLPVVAGGSGRGGETYRTELLLSNSGASPVTARLQLRAPDGIAAGTWTSDLALLPGTGWRVENLAALFPQGVPPTGSLDIDFAGAARDEDVWAGADVVALRNGRSTRTHVPAPQWGSGPGYYIEEAVGPLPRLDPSVRTNVGWADAGDAGPDGPLWSDFHIEAHGSLREDPHRFFALPGQWEQHPLAQLQPDAPDGSLLGLSGPVYYSGPNCCEGNESIAERDLVAYAVEVDQESGDGSTTLFATRSLDVDRSSLFFPVVVRSGGRDGLAWSSELRLGRHGGSAGSSTVRLRFRGEIGGERVETNWTLRFPAGQTIRLDVAAEVLRETGLPDIGQPVVGTLVVAPEEAGWSPLFGELRVSGRKPGVPGAFGVVLQGLPAGRLAATRAIVPALSNDARLRSNLAIANASPPGTAALTLGVALRRSSDGATVATWETTLEPGERAQWNDVGSAIPGAEGSLWAEVRRVAGDGRFSAYGVVHERAGGDGAERPMTGVE